jgi:hypothetical protein
MKRRLEDRIRELCAKAVATPETPEWNNILQQLANALHEHTRRMRKLITEVPIRVERRSVDQISISW